MIMAIDFDGTLCEFDYPNIGEPRHDVIDKVKKCKKLGHKLILWTCREDHNLSDAMDWCNKYGLEFDAINTNLQEAIDKYGGTSRKIFADIYVDDKNISIDKFIKL